MIEDEGNSRDFIHRLLSLRMFVDEVGSDSYGKLSPELFPLESCQRVSLPVGSDEDVELVLTVKKDRIVLKWG